MSSLKKNPNSLNLSPFLLLSFVNIFFSINLLRLKYGIINVKVKLQVHDIWDKLILRFQNIILLYSERPVNKYASTARDRKSFNTVFIMSALINSELGSLSIRLDKWYSFCIQFLNNHQPKGKYFLMKL